MTVQGDHSLRRVLTIRGRTGAVLGMHPLPREDGELVAATLKDLFSHRALSQVKFFSSDSPSAKLFKETREVCPNLMCVSLDPVHLAIVYEYAQWGKKSAGSRILRQLLRKFTQMGASKTLLCWGPFFTGAAPTPLSREEAKARDEILHCNMGQARAKRILDNLDASTPLCSRITFIETVAAICKCFPDEVARKVTGSNKEVSKVLWSATAPDRMEWLLNNLRVRRAMTGLQRALLPSGAASNEALRAEINAWTRSNRNGVRGAKGAKKQHSPYTKPDPVRQVKSKS